MRSTLNVKTSIIDSSLSNNNLTISNASTCDIPGSSKLAKKSKFLNLKINCEESNNTNVLPQNA